MVAANASKAGEGPTVDSMGTSAIQNASTVSGHPTTNVQNV